jgi:hypothetical protein
MTLPVMEPAPVGRGFGWPELLSESLVEQPAIKAISPMRIRGMIARMSFFFIDDTSKIFA